MKIGLIAGAGSLPQNVVKASEQIFVAAITGFSAASDFDVESDEFGLAEFGKISRAFKNADCTHICFAGNVSRPDFKTLRPDLKGLTYLPGAIKAAKEGDDSLLRYVLERFEKEGFEIISPQELCKDLLMPKGHLGQHRLNIEHRDDAEKACKIAAQIGALDIGQAAVVCRGVVLAVEAQEGTDEMLKRVSKLPEALKGNANKREGVLAKIIKSNQDVRVDLPTFGLKTVQLAADAGLAGIVGESGRAFLLDRETAIAEADRRGLFIAGLPPIK